MPRPSVHAASLSPRSYRRAAASPRLTRTARLVQLAVMGGVLALAGGPPEAVAQMAIAPESAQATRRYDIPAGPLSTVLARYASESGVLVAGAGALAQDKTSPGVSGDLDAQAALNALLAGTGLTAAPAADGSYVLRRVAPAAGVATLAPVTVQADAFNATEGTHSYAMTGPCQSLPACRSRCAKRRKPSA